MLYVNCSIPPQFTSPPRPMGYGQLCYISEFGSEGSDGVSNDSLIFIAMLGGGLEGMSAAVQMQLNLEREEVMCQP